MVPLMKTLGLTNHSWLRLKLVYDQGSLALELDESSGNLCVDVAYLLFTGIVIFKKPVN